MAGITINLSTLPTVIDTFKTMFQDCDNKFNNIQDTFIELKCTNQSEKDDLKSDVLEIKNAILRQLKFLNDFDIDEQHYITSYCMRLDDIERVLGRFKMKFEEIQNSFVILEEKSFKSFEQISNIEEPEKTFSKESIINPHDFYNRNILQSRQTDNPFILMTMETGARYKCSGCKEHIPIQSIYLSHIEEYPSGSNTYLPHSYHINQECLSKRGFSSSYLQNINVCSNESFTIDINLLNQIGFDFKNIHITNLSTKGIGWDTINDDDDMPDNISENSYVSSKCDLESSPVNPISMFFYNRKNPDQKKVYICEGCQLPIDNETYLTYQKKPQNMVHIKRSCLQSAGIYPKSFGRCVVKVAKFLKTHGDLKELLACGFYYNKIIGFRPTGNHVSEPLRKKPSAEKVFVKQSPHEVEFLFNSEPFHCQRLSRGEKCAGCNLQIKTNELLLRHQERIPRERLDHRPLISQYYHLNKQCLFSRGFTLKYLGLSSCNVTLSGEDNLSRIKDSLVKCGFDNERISYSYKSSEEIKGFEATPFVEKPIKNYKLFMDNCSNSVKCEGCGFTITINQPCFIYSTTPVQDSNAKLFHILSSCIKFRFNKDQIAGIPCVKNNSLDISPNELINCGIIKIEPDNSSKYPLRNQNKHNKNPRESNKKPSLFCVDIVLDDHVSCHACKRTLTMDKYVLKKVETNKYMYIHVDPNCVKELGLSPVELANSRVSYNVYVSHEGVGKLKACGFQQLPKN